MEFGATWNTYFVVFGLLASLVKCVPMDMDSVKDGIQMGLLTGVGMAMDLADKAKIQGNFDKKISLGPLKFEEKMGGGMGLMNDNDDDEEDRKRRRRSVDTEEKLSEVVRSKRSPCLGRRRAQQTTAAPAAGGGAAGGGAAGGGTAGGGTAGGGTAPAAPTVPRRRKRSSDYNDSNDNIIPFQNTFAGRAEDLGEKIRQIMKSMLDAMVGVIDNISKSILNGSNSPPDMQ